VDAAAAPPLVTARTEESGEWWPAALAAVGMEVRVSEVGPFLVVEARRPAAGFAPLPPAGWAVRASHNAGAAHHLLDRDVATAWETDAPQSPGQWIEVDLGAETAVARVDLLAIDWQAVPAGLAVELSRDGRAFHTAVSVPRYWGPVFVAGPHPFLRVRRGRVQASFPAAPARFVRVVQTGSAPGHEWAARELFVYGPAPPPPAPPPADLAAALRRESVEWAYADPWVAAALRAGSAERIRTQDSNLFVNGHGRDRPPPGRLDRFRPLPGRGLVVAPDADAAGIRAALAGQGGAVLREAAVGPYRLLVLGPAAPAPRRIARTGWSVRAGDETAAAWRAIDGDPATVWASAGPADPAAGLTLDLRAVHAVRRVRVRPGPGDGGLGDLALEGSTDGVRFAPLGPLAWAGPAWWSGWELLRLRAHAWEVALPPTAVRFLRLRPAGPAAGPWVVGEIECFE
jgi:hypothetical protein